MGHQVYPLAEGEATTEPVPVYTGSPPPVPLSEQPPTQAHKGAIGAFALLALAVVLYLLFGR